jgi:hypothetical protein
MSATVIAVLTGCAEDGRQGDHSVFRKVRQQGEKASTRRQVDSGALEDSPLENPVTECAAKDYSEPKEAEKIDYQHDLWLYRDRTITMLRHYFRISVEVGRLPSLVGREFFRSRVTSYRAASFEDAVIFVHDISRVLDYLDEFEMSLIGKLIMHDYSQGETALLMRRQRRTISRRYLETIDKLSELFLRNGLLTRLPGTETDRSRTCQEAEIEKISVSRSE